MFLFWNLHQIWKILKKKMIVIAIMFPKLQTLKNFVRDICKKRHFATRLKTQHYKVSQTLANSRWERFYHVFPSFREKLIWKISPIILGEILGMFLDTLSDDGKYPIEDWENFPLPIQRQLPQNLKIFSQFFVGFLESTKIMFIANVFPKLQTVKNFLRPLCKKRLFGTRFHTQHDKVS